MQQLTPQQLDALGRMSKEIHEEYRNLKFAGMAVDPVRYLSFREQTRNYLYTRLVVADSGVFFIDAARKIKYRFDPAFLFVYHDGLLPSEEEQVRNSATPILMLDNSLEFWKRHNTGLCLVADHLNRCEYLLADQKPELERVRNLYSAGSLVINPMLHRKFKESTRTSNRQILSLED